MIQTLSAAVLSVAIPLGALYTPLVHAHVDARDLDHHGAHTIHAHVVYHWTRSTTADQARLNHDETGRAVYLQLFVAVAHASFEVPAAVPTACDLDLGAPAESPAHPHHLLHVVHSHDPPFLRSLPSRAPPAFLP
ncbi:MAG: hypothetical protein HYX77_01470 [Acidobacteria bacterium]|nr:hypothetical protein [Acidobacteriota bacterium]